MSSKLARSLNLTVRTNRTQVQTPLLVPSFSSKALVGVDSLFTTLQPYITESFLLSAYDISRHDISFPSTAAADVQFLDSGGYEVSLDHNPSDPMYGTPPTNAWTLNDYKSVLADTNTITPTFATSYDHPQLRNPLDRQISDAISLFQEHPRFGRAFLIKPESQHQHLVDISSVASQVDNFSEFDIIGITEAELGTSILERMNNIAYLRQMMDSRHILKPLHIYGSLDPVCTPLYFLAGADIFDGLSWLRFSYRRELAIYHKNRVPLDFNLDEPEDLGRMRSYIANLHYLVSELTPRLKRYLLDKDESRLGIHSNFFKEALDNLRVKLPGIV